MAGVAVAVRDPGQGTERAAAQAARRDQWVEVIGTYAAPVPHPSHGYPQAVITPVSVRPVDPPADTYAG